MTELSYIFLLVDVLMISSMMSFFLGFKSAEKRFYGK